METFEERRKSWEDRMGQLIADMMNEPDSRGLPMVCNPDDLIEAFYRFESNIAAARIRHKYRLKVEEVSDVA